jgi:hypothetical protein
VLIPLTAPVQNREIAIATMPGQSSYSTWRTRLLQSHAASTILAARVFTDQFDTGAIKRIDHPGQGFDDAADIPDARFHPLDGRQRNPGQFRERPLVDAQQSPRCSHLEGRDHWVIPYFKMINDI